MIYTRQRPGHDQPGVIPCDRPLTECRETIVSRPLLVVDGDSFAHRAYHALPKTIRRRGDKGAGTIVGFANFSLRLYEDERLRAVLVGWDTLEAPTYRHDAFADYQSGCDFDA
jgi:DNA polymerase I